jgi:hypothetical protein
MPTRPARIRSYQQPVTASAVQPEPEPPERHLRPEPESPQEQPPQEPELQEQPPQEPELQEQPQEPEQPVRCRRRRKRSEQALQTGRSEQVWSSSSIPQKVKDYENATTQAN